LFSLIYDLVLVVITQFTTNLTANEFLSR